MRVGLLFLGVAAAAWMAPSAGLAQERPNGFYLMTPLSLSSGYDNNFVVGPRALDDSVSLLTTPTFTWMTNTHRSMFSADYTGEFELFANHQDMDAWNHAANLHFRHQITARWSIDGADSFLSTMDPTRVLFNSLLLLPWGRYQENALYTRASYRLDHKTVMSFRFDNTYTTMDLPRELAARLDVAGVAGTASVDHTFNSHHAVEANYSYLYIHPLDQGFGAINSHVHNINLGYTYTVNPGLIIRLFAGGTRSIQPAFTGVAAVDKKLGNVWVSAGFQRYLAFFGQVAPVGTPVGTVPLGAGVAPNSIYEVVALRAWGKLTRRVGIQGGVQRALNGVTIDNQGIKSVVAQLRLDYKLNDRVTAFARTDFYGQNINEFTAFPISRRRYFGGLEFTLSRAPELSGDPHRHKPPVPESEQGDARPPEDR